ncbi:MAG: hypothetical protein IPK28_11145 [Devosia sp.]|nr:hypothetical protein [Devosia sp.]
MMQHFGWRMRNGKLTQPPAEVDSDLMQRQFNTWLRKQGVLSARMLDVDHDYERKFILIQGGVGQTIDDGLRWLRETDNGRYWSLYHGACWRPSRRAQPSRTSRSTMPLGARSSCSTTSTAAAVSTSSTSASN